MKNIMRKLYILFVFILLLPCITKAVNYYVNPISGDDSQNGLSPATAWETISKVNSSFSSFSNGDSLLFLSGSSNYGSIVATKSFTGSGFVIGKYNGSSKAIITGFVNPVTWFLESGSTFYTVVSAPYNVNLVTRGGIIQTKCRYPNASTIQGLTGWIIATAGGNNTTNGGINTITSATILPYNPVGGNIVYKPVDWMTPNDSVTGQSANIISFQNAATGNVYAPAAGTGFFVQNKKEYLDNTQEFYYDVSATRLYVMGNPTTFPIRISTIQTGIDLNSRSGITIENLYIEGFNDISISALNTSGNILIKNCVVNYSGKDGIDLLQSPNSTITNTEIYNCLNSAGYIRKTGTGVANIEISYCTISQIAQYCGMGIERDAAGRAAATCYADTGNTGTVTISNNNISAIGYAPIEYQGNNVLVENNLIDTFCNVTQDGGGIYSYVSNSATPKQFSNRIIRNNIILHGIGNNGGRPTALKARGIYCDEGVNHVLIYNNTIAYMSDRGLYGNNYSNITWRGNVVFRTAGFTAQKLSSNPATLTNNLVMSNQFYPYNFIGTYTPFTGFTVDSSRYYLTSSTPVRIGSTNYSFAQWQGTFSQEAHAIPTFSQIDSLRLVYNETLSPITVVLGATYQTVTGAAVTSVDLDPFESMVLKFISNNPDVPLDYLKTRRKFRNAY